VKELLINLLKISSLTKQESEIAQYIESKLKTRELFAQELSARDLSARDLPSLERIGDSLIVKGPFKPERKTVALVGHIDTVPGDNEVFIDGDRIVGLGASDMKGGIAVMLSLIEAGILEKSRFNLYFIFYAREEGPNKDNELHIVLQKYPELKSIDLAFFLEPTDNAIHLGACASMGCNVTVRGKRAHSARPWQGENAIHKAGQLISKINSLAIIDVPIGDLVYREVISVTKVQGGIAGNVIPDECNLYLNIRAAPGSLEQDVKDRVRAILPSDVTFSFTDWNPPGKVPIGNEIYKEFKNMFSLSELPKQAYTDVSMFSEAGIDAINFGPGLTSQAHQKGEYILNSMLEENFRIFMEFLK